MTKEINLNVGDTGATYNNTVRAKDLDLTQQKKPWEKGFAGAEEHRQKQLLQRALGDSGMGISNREVK